MLLHRICNDRFGNRFALLTPRQSRPHPKIKPCRFTSQLQARRFMGQLQTPTDYWRHVYLESKLSNKASPRNQRILDEIAEMLYRGVLKFYQMEPFALSSKQPLGVIDSDQTIYAIRPVNYLLSQKPSELKYFADESQAMTFLAETGASDDELTTLLEEHDIDTQPNVKVAAAKALVEETLIVTVTRYTRPPTPDESAFQTPVFVDKLAGLGPAVDDEFKEISIDLADEFEGNAGAAYASLFDGVEYTLKTDTGEEHKGVLQGGKINIPKAKMGSGFELSFKDMPAFSQA